MVSSDLRFFEYVCSIHEYADPQLRWARIVGALVKLCQNKGTVDFALRHVVPRMAASQAYLESTRSQKNVPPDFETQSILWRNYAVASCSAFGTILRQKLIRAQILTLHQPQG